MVFAIIIMKLHYNSSDASITLLEQISIRPNRYPY